MRLSTFWYAAILLAAILLAVDLTRPLMPIDETRYLTVAWEYYIRDSWILPTLNFEPYHHKPPMLFWLINAFWHGTGTTDMWAARLVTLVGALGTIFLTIQIGRVLWPQATEKGDIAALMLLACPFFLIYGSIIMFDTLLAVAVLLGIYAILKAYLTAERRYWILLGIAFGFGALIKGPVILLHLLPVLLIGFVWQLDYKTSRRFWFGGIFFALLMGVAIGLSWAIPAAKLGGPDYEKMIFWGQSAGRMVQSFDHARPFWFYLALLPAITLPWVLVLPLWRRGQRPAQTGTWQSRFLLCWMVPVFIAFMAISGKQVHYLMPLLPAFFLLLAHYVMSRGFLFRITPLRLFLWAIIPALLLMIAVAIAEDSYKFITVAEGSKAALFMEQIRLTDPRFVQLAIALIIALGFVLFAKRSAMTPACGLKAIALVYAGIIIALHFSVQPMLARYYDIAPAGLALAAERNNDTPLAVARQWQGELGYLAHLNRKVDVVQVEQMRAWFNKNPGGIMIYRHDMDEPPKGYKVLYQQPYRAPTKALSLITIK